jgi:hypothetical protein
MRVMIDTIAGPVEAWVEAGERSARLCLRLPRSELLRPALVRDLEVQRWARQEGCQSDFFVPSPSCAFVRKFRSGPTNQAVSQAMASVVKAFVGLAMIPTMQ